MSSRIWIGLLFVVFGIGFLLHQADIWDFSMILSNWWPLILIVIGIILLINRTYSSAVTGFLFLVIGGLLLVNEWIDINVAALIWPIIFIFVGLIVIFSRGQREKTIHTERDVNSFSLFSGTDVRSQSGNFQGGNVTAIFGGAELDLRDIIVSEEGAKLDLTAVFGGISITVPRNVHVEISGIPIFGGWENKTRPDDPDDVSVIHVNCLTVCGGVEIKN